MPAGDGQRIACRADPPAASSARAGRRRSRSPPSGSPCRRGARWRSAASSRPSASRSSSVRSTPARRAMAMRWTTALVEQPGRHGDDGGVPAGGAGDDPVGRQILPDHVDDAPAAVGATCAGGSQSTAGIDEAPGRVSPMRIGDRRHGRRRCPWSCRCRPSGRCRPARRAIPRRVMLPARRSSQYFQASEPEPRILPA